MRASWHPGHTAFVDGFDPAAVTNDNLTRAAMRTETQPSRQKWGKQIGVLKKELVARSINGLTAPITQFCGTTGTV